MPFKSEAQRRYLWANEPEIAKDWTDTYGSKIQAADGGIMRLAHGGRTGFYVGGSHHAGSTTDMGGTTGQDNSADRGGNVHQNIAQKAFNKAHTTAPNTLSDPEEKRDYFTQSWSGPETFFGGGYRGLKQPGVTGGDNPYQSKLGGLWQGALGILGGLPGTLMGMLSNINPTLQGWRENLTGYKTQQEWEDARDERIAKQRIGNILATQQKYGTLSPTLQNRLAGLRQQIGYTANDAVPSGNYITRKNTGILQAVPHSKFTKPGIEQLVDTNYDPQDRSTWFDTHPATGESVFNPAFHEKHSFSKRFAGQPLEWLSGLPSQGFGTFVRDYNKRNEPYPFINSRPEEGVYENLDEYI